MFKDSGFGSLVSPYWCAGKLTTLPTGTSKFCMAKKAGSSRCPASCLPEWDVHGQWNWSAEAIIGQDRSGFCSKPGLLQHRELLLPRVCIRHCSTLFIQFQNWVFSGCQAWSMHSTAECRHCADSRESQHKALCVRGRRPGSAEAARGASHLWSCGQTISSPLDPRESCRENSPRGRLPALPPEVGAPKLPFPW